MIEIYHTLKYWIGDAGIIMLIWLLAYTAYLLIKHSDNKK